MLFLCCYLSRLVIRPSPVTRHNARCHLHTLDYKPTVLIHNSSISASRITDSVYKLKRYGEGIQPWLTPFSVFNLGQLLWRPFHNDNCLVTVYKALPVERPGVLESVKSLLYSNQMKHVVSQCVIVRDYVGSH